ncbi:hypothetical protein H7K38_14260 [Mycobacterium alsense]|uniref:PE-PGRS family protein n=1 Tax=Mycobacterium alsense TaxID=324058 RepID=A0AA41XQE2_9MYCO|nr:hypothetical protein [Mycobacterium alsense]MCV7379814.1 hypothetical protein [Mycobacterium alsense]
MELTARPYLTAGVSLASAAVIAAGPMTQHLPKLDVAQHLPKVSVTDINLTDTASPMMDLFAGIENQLASLAGGASAAAVPAAVVSNAVDPIQTWVTTFQNAGMNLQYIYNTWSMLPFPVVQQIAANGVQYASEYVGAYQNAASGALHYFLGLGPSGAPPLIPALQTAWSAALSGNITGAVNDVYQAIYATPVIWMLQPLEDVLNIPTQMAQNLANGMTYLNGPFRTGFGSDAILTLPNTIPQSLGPSLQAVYNSWTAGDQIGAVTNLLNTPGVVANAFLNGFSAHPGLQPPSGGLLSSPAFFFKTLKGKGVTYDLVNTLLPNFAKAIVTPGAQNIAQGGSLATALQNFANQLINGWPPLTGLPTPAANLITSLTSSLGSIGSQLTSLLQNTASSVMSGLGSLGSMAGAFASQIGTLLINLLRLL